MKKTKWLEFFLYPNKLLGTQRGKKKYEKSRNNIMVFNNAIMCGKQKGSL